MVRIVQRHFEIIRREGILKDIAAVGSDPEERSAITSPGGSCFALMVRLATREPVVKAPILGRCAAIHWAKPCPWRRQNITLSANCRQNGRTELSRATFITASYAAHRLGSCIDSVTVHGDSGFVLRVFGRVDNERLLDAIAVIFGLRAR